MDESGTCQYEPKRRKVLAEPKLLYLRFVSLVKAFNKGLCDLELSSKLGTNKQFRDSMDKDADSNWYSS